MMRIYISYFYSITESFINFGSWGIEVESCEYYRFWCFRVPKPACFCSDGEAKYSITIDEPRHLLNEAKLSIGKTNGFSSAFRKVRILSIAIVSSVCAMHGVQPV